jgi:hypothetical protein
MKYSVSYINPHGRTITEPFCCIWKVKKRVAELARAGVTATWTKHVNPGTH